MENASKALLIAGGMLIAILVISIGTYLILSASGVSEKFDKEMSDSDIEKFNQKFEVFEKESGYSLSGESDQPIYQYNKIPGDKSEYVFTNYNSASDVVSAINLAYNINKSVDYDTEKGIQIVIIGLKDVPVIGNRFGITPITQKKLAGGSIDARNKFYSVASDGTVKISTFSPSEDKKAGDLVSTNWILENYSNSKLVKLNSKKQRVYEHGFNGKVILNTNTGMVDRIIFTYVKNELYDN